MSIKTFIFSQPDKPIVKEKKEIDQTYKKFRFEIIASVFISYAVFYLTRKNFSAAMPAMLTETSLTAEDFAIMSSIFYILYGAMKFVGGMLVDKINPKAMTGPVLIGVGIVNILFGFSDSVAAVYVLYSLNAILQGTSFPPMAKIMASWFSKNERGRWWAIVEAASAYARYNSLIRRMTSLRAAPVSSQAYHSRCGTADRKAACSRHY